MKQYLVTYLTKVTIKEGSGTQSYIVAKQTKNKTNPSSFSREDCFLHLSSIQSLSHVSATPWTEAHQAFPSISHSRSLLKLMSIESVMPSNLLILCRPLPPAFNQSLFKWVSPSHQVTNVVEFQLQHQSFLRMDCLDLLAVPCSSRDSQESSPKTIVQRHQFFSTQLSL